MNKNITKETKLQDFSKFTKQGYEIIDIFELAGRKIVVFKRDIKEYNRVDYNWGNYYNVDDGTWSFGHYCFETKFDCYCSIHAFFSTQERYYREP